MCFKIKLCLGNKNRKRTATKDILSLLLSFTCLFIYLFVDLFWDGYFNLDVRRLNKGAYIEQL